MNPPGGLLDHYIYIYFFLEHSFFLLSLIFPVSLVCMNSWTVASLFRDGFPVNAANFIWQITELGYKQNPVWRTDLDTAVQVHIKRYFQKSYDRTFRIRKKALKPNVAWDEESHSIDILQKKNTYKIQRPYPKPFLSRQSKSNYVLTQTSLFQCKAPPIYSVKHLSVSVLGR